MAVRLGSNPVTDIRLGGTPVQQVRLGSQLVWSRTSGVLRYDFPVDGPLFADAAWADHGPAVAPNRAIVEQGSVRVYLNDAAFAEPLYVSQARTVAQTPGDDGYLEVGIAAAGDPDPTYYTDVYRRMSNAAFTYGVGMRFVAGSVQIVRKLGGVDSVQAACGSYGPGDKFRQVDQGNQHLVLRNGTDVGGWNDVAGSAAKGDGFRAVGLRVNGAKPAFFFLTGPRRYSASVDYIEAA